MAVVTSNFLLDTIGVLIAIAVVLYTYFQWSFKYWQRRNVVVPLEPVFPFGNLGNPVWTEKNLGESKADIYFQLKKQNKRFGGTYTFYSPGLVIADPEILRCILSKDFQHFTDRGLPHNEKLNPLSANMFVVGGSKWRNLRTKLSPTFTSGKMKMMFQTLVDCSGLLVKSVEAQTLDKTPIDIKEHLGRFTTDVIGSCAFGLECNSFEDSEFRKQGRNLFETSFTRAIRNSIALFLPKLAAFLGLSNLSKDQINFFLNIVNDTINFREKNNYERNDFFQLLMEIKKNSELDENEEPFTLVEFAAQVFLFFVAGFETSSTTMTFAFYELARHPDIQSKVREEVNEVLKKHGGKFSYDAMQDMKLLRCVIDEALRLYPAVPVLFRRCTSEYQIPDTDVIIEKGVVTEIPVMGIQRDPEYFPDPDEFRPERFNDENKENIKPFTYLPFGDGPRNCIGLRFGIMQSKVGMAVLLKNFEFSLNEKTGSPLKFNPRSFVTAAADGIWLKATKIEEPTGSVP